jgi:signal transduction histidine kinase
MNLSYLLPPLVVAGISTILLVIVLLKGRQQGVVYWVFSLLLLSITLWALVIFAMRASPDAEHALLWERAVPAMGFATAVFCYHFSLSLTKIRKRKVLLHTSYLFMGVVAALSPTSLFIQRMDVHSYGYAPIIGPAVIPVLAFAYFLSIMALYNLVKGYQTSRLDEERNRLLYITMAMVFPLVGSAVDLFPTFYPASIFGNIAFCLLTSVAILKYNLLDIRIVARKSLAYLLVSVLVAIPYVAILYSLHYIFEPQLEPWWVHFIIILLLAIVLRPLYSWAQNFVDKLFYRDRYDYLKALKQFSREAQSIVNLKELSSTLTQLVSGALHTSGACLLLPSGNDNGFVMASSTSLGSPPSGVVLKNSSRLIKWLKLQQRILSSEELNIVPQLQSLSLRERNSLEQMEAKLYIPIQTEPGRLSGILVLGQKLSQQPYSSEEKELLTALSSQMAIALENARLYAASQQEVAERKRAEEELRQSHEQLRNLSAHIESTTETERTSIAREVHDELGQALTAIKMDLSWINKRLPKEQETIIKKTGEMSRLIDTTIQTVKRISTKLRPGVLDDLGLIAAIEWQVQEFQERTRIKCELTADGEDINIDRDLATAVFRILQEALTNVARHAIATRVEVSLKKGDGQLVLQVRDNGKGITEKQIAHPKSLGLIGMRERAHSWNGSIKIDGISGKGTAVTVSIPLNRKERLDDKNTSRR